VIGAAVAPIITVPVVPIVVVAIITTFALAVDVVAAVGSDTEIQLSECDGSLAGIALLQSSADSVRTHIALATAAIKLRASVAAGSCPGAQPVLGRCSW
jgi:hypothetical protein